MGKFELGIICDIIRSDRWDLTGLSIASGVSVKKLKEYIGCCGEVPLADAVAVAQALGVELDDIYLESNNHRS